MGLRVVCRLTVLMAVLLGLGVVARDAIVADVGAKMSVVSADTANSNGCKACGGGNGMSAEDLPCHLRQPNRGSVAC